MLVAEGEVRSRGGGMTTVLRIMTYSSAPVLLICSFTTHPTCVGCGRLRVDFLLNPPMTIKFDNVRQSRQCLHFHSLTRRVTTPTAQLLLNDLQLWCKPGSVQSPLYLPRKSLVAGFEATIFVVKNRKPSNAILFVHARGDKTGVKWGVAWPEERSGYPVTTASV